MIRGDREVGSAVMGPARVDALIDLAYGALSTDLVAIMNTNNIGITSGSGVFASCVAHVVRKMARFGLD
jgi:hypothetical protein